MLPGGTCDKIAGTRKQPENHRAKACVRVDKMADTQKQPENHRAKGCVGVVRHTSQNMLREALKEIDHSFDYIIVDCAPSLSLITVNALAAVHGVLIPMQCEYYALEGLADLTQTIDRIQQALNPDLKIIGVLRTMYDARNALTRDVSEELEQYFGKKLYDTVIPRNVRLAEAPAHGLPIIFFEKSSKGAVAYLNLAAEMVKKSKVQKGMTA